MDVTCGSNYDIQEGSADSSVFVENVYEKANIPLPVYTPQYPACGITSMLTEGDGVDHPVEDGQKFIVQPLDPKAHASYSFKLAIIL